MSPFGLETLPADVLKALRTVPELGERLQEVAVHTAVLAGIKDDVAAIDQNTRGLHRIETGVASLADDLSQVNKRLATIEDSMPDLVEVQQHLARLPETMRGLDEGIAGLTELLTRLVATIETLDRNVGALQESMEPVGRLADKLPGGSRRT